MNESNWKLWSTWLPLLVGAACCLSVASVLIYAEGPVVLSAVAGVTGWALTLTFCLMKTARIRAIVADRNAERERQAAERSEREDFLTRGHILFLQYFREGLSRLTDAQLYSFLCRVIDWHVERLPYPHTVFHYTVEELAGQDGLLRELSREDRVEIAKQMRKAQNHSIIGLSVLQGWSGDGSGVHIICREGWSYRSLRRMAEEYMTTSGDDERDERELIADLTGVDRDVLSRARVWAAIHLH